MLAVWNVLKGMSSKQLTGDFRIQANFATTILQWQFRWDGVVTAQKKHKLLTQANCEKWKAWPEIKKEILKDRNGVNLFKIEKTDTILCQLFCVSFFWHKKVDTVLYQFFCVNFFWHKKVDTDLCQFFCVSFFWHRKVDTVLCQKMLFSKSWHDFVNE